MSPTPTDNEAFERALRAFAAERNYSAAMVTRWLQLAPADAGALFTLAHDLRLGEHQLGDLWEWAEEIAERDRISLAQVLELESIVAALQARLSRNDKLKSIKAVLRRVRFPQLGAAEERLRALVRDLHLPRTVQVSLPDFLEGGELQVTIVAHATADVRDAARALLAAADSPACEEMFALLSEAP